MSSTIWAWIAGVIVGMMILGLFIIPPPPRHNRGAVLVIVRNRSEQQAETKAPPGHWVVIRRFHRE